MKIAFASSDGVAVNRHFGLTDAYYLWEVDREVARCVGSVGAPEGEGDQEDKILARARLLEGCTLVYSMQIGGPAAAKLVGRHIHPLKTTTETPIKELIEKLQIALQTRPPPWLAKAMGLSNDRTLQYAEEE